MLHPQNKNAQKGKNAKNATNTKVQGGHLKQKGKKLNPKRPNEGSSIRARKGMSNSFVANRKHAKVQNQNSNAFNFFILIMLTFILLLVVFGVIFVTSLK